MENQNGSLLDLQTTIERKHITVDGKAYMLRQLSEFSLLDRHTFAQHGRAMAGMEKIGKDEMGALIAVEKASEALDATFLRIVMDSDDLVGKLNDEQKLAVLNCFFQQVGATPTPTTNSETSTSSVPHDSNVSTEEVLTTG